MHQCRGALIPALVLASIGCGTPRPIKYYQLQIPTTPTPASSTYPVDIMVGRVTGSDLLQASPIIYRTNRNQIGTYQYHRWSDTPVQMVEEKLVRMLRATGEYQSVSGMGSSSGADLVVRGRLYDFTEIDAETISGLVSMEMELFNRRTAKVLWTHFYTATEAVEGKDVPAVAEALDRNLDRGLKEVVAGLSKYFAANSPEKVRASETTGAVAK